MTWLWSRLGPETFTDSVGRVFFVLWNQNNKRPLMEAYEQLPRKGGSASFSRMPFESVYSLAMPPILLHANGVRVGALGDDFLEKYLPSTTTHPEICRLTPDMRRQFIAFSQARAEFAGAVCHISGNFDLEPNRADLSRREHEGLKGNEGFLVGLANALSSMYLSNRTTHGKNLRFLLECHAKEQEGQNSKTRAEEDERRHELANNCLRLVLSDARAADGSPVAIPEYLRPLQHVHLLAPDRESTKMEKQLEKMVSEFTPLLQYHLEQSPADASDQSTRARALRTFLGIHPLLTFGTGIDALTLARGTVFGEGDPLATGSKVCDATCNLEYKWILDSSYNHELQSTDKILQWRSLGAAEESMTIVDKLEARGVPCSDRELEGFGLRIKKVFDRHGNVVRDKNDSTKPHAVDILSLHDLLRHALSDVFDFKIVQPVEKKGEKKAAKRGRD